MSDARLGIRANLPQFVLLVVINAFVGAMIGLERSILPDIASREFHLAAAPAILSFIVVFGVSKALTNYLAGRVSDVVGRRRVLIVGWIVALPVPLLLMWAPSWTWILVANVFLGVSQGLTWSTTVVMKIDLAGPARRGFAMGLNEFAGYLAVAISALATGEIASRTHLRPEPFYLGAVFVVCGLVLSLFAKETLGHVAAESRAPPSLAQPSPSPSSPFPAPTAREVFARVTYQHRALSSFNQAGFVNNLNDGCAWGLFPLLFASHDIALDDVAILAALYPASWGALQLVTGALSDRVGRRPLIVLGMITQAAALAVVAVASSFAQYAAAALVLGAGTALVYPTLIAAIGDHTQPAWRASAVGVYRLWRDLGYAAGAVVAGVLADVVGVPHAILVVAALTLASGIVVAVRAR